MVFRAAKGAISDAEGAERAQKGGQELAHGLLLGSDARALVVDSVDRLTGGRPGAAQTQNTLSDRSRDWKNRFMMRLVCFVASGRSGRPHRPPHLPSSATAHSYCTPRANRRRGRWHAALPSARVNRVRRYRIEKTENAPKGRSEIGRVRQGDRSCGERRRSRRERLGVFHQAVLLQALADGAARHAQPFADLGLVAVELGQGEGQQLALEPVA